MQKEPSAISYLDIYEAIENKPIIDFKNSNVGNLFENKELIQRGKQQLTETMSTAAAAFKSELKKHLLTELVPKDANGNLLVIDWSRK